MFAECPVIATTTGGLPDVVRDKETGLLVPPCDPAALSSAMLDTLTNTDATGRRVSAAVDYADSCHTIDAMGERILKTLGSNEPV